MKKSLTIEELKERIDKPVFVVGKPVGSIYGNKNWRILKSIGVNEFNELNIIIFTDNSEISAEEQDKFRFFDEEVTFQEIKEILESEEKSKKKTGYETVGKGENYFFISSFMKVEKEYSYYFKNSYDVARVECANHFNNENLAENIARAERLRYQLRRFAALNGGIPSQKDWQNKRCNKYFIYYGCNENKIYSFEINLGRDFGQIYFKDREACKKAIEIFKYELIWYFTEFEEQLY